MTTLVIVLMWVMVIALMFGSLYAISNVGFWLFVQVFGVIDRYLHS